MMDDSPRKNGTNARFGTGIGDERYFFLLITIVMVFIYAISLNNIPDLRQSPRLIVFTVLALAYTALFWLPLVWELGGRGAVIYLIVQAALAYVLIGMVNSVGLAFGVVAPLIGMALGMMPSLWAQALAIIGLLALTFAAVIQVQGTAGVSDLLWLALPMTVFIIIYVVLYGRQAEARERAQALASELEQANAKLAAYAAEVEDLTLAAERQRLARELHDTLAQGVAGLILQLEAVDAHLENDNPARARIIVEQAMARARGTLTGARRAIDDLREESSVPLDLETALRGRVERFSTVTAVPCRLELALPAAVPDPVAEHVLRVVSEGLANVARHARATTVRVSAKVEHQRLQVEIEDNGVGFEPGQAVLSGHYGLQGIRERARLAGGSARITSKKGGGTTITVIFPLAGAES